MMQFNLFEYITICTTYFSLKAVPVIFTVEHPNVFNVNFSNFRYYSGF